VHSPTNAAVLRDCGLDLVIVISPMSGPAGWRPDFYAAARRHSTRLLDREVRALEGKGTRTVVFAPGVREQQVMGNDMMSRDRLNEVIQESFLATGRRAATPGLVDLVRRAAAAR
jgi:NTE family protein